jgi:putative Flp pilus-assembly TadE/G-like protein
MLLTCLSKRPKHQRGQAAVFVVVFIPIVLISLVFLYKAGLLTSEKIKLQNAADATAFSVTTLQARDLNFASYMNRAMVANEVAIGQMVGLTSWAFNWKSYGHYMKAYSRAVIVPMVSGIATPAVGESFDKIITGIAEGFFIKPGTYAAVFMKKVGGIGVKVLHTANRAYSLAQSGYHFMTMAYILSVLGETIDENAPGASLSDFGILSLIANQISYGYIPLPGLDRFTKNYSSSKNPLVAILNREGFQRFASITNASGDPFNKERGWEYLLELIDIHVDESVGKAGIEVGFKLDFELGFNLTRKGGTELRSNPLSLIDGAKRYNWSAADVTGTDIVLDFYTEAYAEVAGIDFRVGGGVKTARNLATLRLVFETPLGDIPVSDIRVPFPTIAPFSAGISQAYKALPQPDSCKKAASIYKQLAALPLGGSKKKTKLKKRLAKANKKCLKQTKGAKGTAIAENKMINLAMAPLIVGNQRNTAYGGAPVNALAWLTGLFPLMPPHTGPIYIPPQVPTVSFNADYVAPPGSPARLQDNNISRSYSGLNGYVDSQNVKDRYGFEAPYFTVGLVKGVNSIGATGPQPSGQFELNDASAGEQLAVIARSELYFKRPSDLDYFDRKDGKEELGSAFNPYWQSRLAPTSQSDKILALWMQQGENFDDDAALPDLQVKERGIMGIINSGSLFGY